MDAPLRSNGSNTRPALATAPPGGRSKVAGKVERVLNTALAGERAAVLNVSATDLLSEPEGVAAALGAALDRPGVGPMGHWMVQDLFRRSALREALVDALAHPEPRARAAAARICGAARLPEASPWIADLLEDADPRVREAAVRSLAQFGGRRAVERLLAVGQTMPLHRLAIALSRAASDLDIEELMRSPSSERVAVATVLACGLRRDALRVPALLAIAHDRRWPKQVRLASCKALAAVGDPSASGGLHQLAEQDPDPELRQIAHRAHVRLLRRAVARPR